MVKGVYLASRHNSMSVSGPDDASCAAAPRLRMRCVLAWMHSESVGSSTTITSIFFMLAISHSSRMLRVWRAPKPRVSVVGFTLGRAKRQDEVCVCVCLGGLVGRLAFSP